MEFDSPDRSSSRDNRPYSAVIFEYLAIISTTFLPLGFYFWSFRFIVLLECTPLERMVRTEFECGAMEYCQKMKLNKAFLLLQNTDLPIRQIAELLKFYDERHFCSFFTRRMQVTPNHYRNETRHIV